MIKTLVIAPVLTRSGYGEHGRFIIDALTSRPDIFDLYVHPLHWGNSNWITSDDQNTSCRSDGRSDVAPTPPKARQNPAAPASPTGR